jgi:hypothetical protein
LEIVPSGSIHLTSALNPQAGLDLDFACGSVGPLVFGLENVFRASPSRLSQKYDFGLCVLSVFFVTLTLPCLVFRYLPMVDLPQHEAIVSIMLNLHKRSLGFDSYYVWAPTRTLYVAPYMLAIAVAKLTQLRFAMHVVVFCVALSYPLGVLLCLRTLGRPAYLGFLAFPLVYNQTFFWGFIHFNFAMGLAFATIAALVGSWSKNKALLVAVLSMLTALSHVYGLLVLGAYVGLWILLGDRRAALRRLPALAPALAALVAWAVLLPRAHGFWVFKWSGVVNRWSKFPESIAGGWRDHTEALFLCGLVVLIMAFSRSSAPITISRWKALSDHQRVMWTFIVLNVALYLSMPELSIAANMTSFRHAEMAALALPLTVSARDAAAAPNWMRLCLVVLACGVVMSSWYHFNRFDKEARSFDALVSAVPERSRVVQLTYDRHGRVARAPVYVHFAAYVHAEKGGYLAMNFPARFWNIPVAVRADVELPAVPQGLEWNPLLFGKPCLNEYFDHVIVRASRTHAPLTLPQPFPYQLEFQNGPWWLLRRYESTHEQH